MTDDVVLAMEDPLGADGAALIAELVALLGALYPEDSDEIAVPWTVDDIARAGAFVVARALGEPAGCAGLAPMDLDLTLEIVRMYVRPAFRGRRIADRMLAALEGAAQARGAEVLMLRCGPRQPEALKVYERNGYVRRGRFAHHREHPMNVFYEKRLGAGEAQ